MTENREDVEKGYEETLIGPQNRLIGHRSLLPKGASQKDIDEHRARIDAYWTPERRANAIPIDSTKLRQDRKPREAKPGALPPAPATSMPSTTLVADLTVPPYSSAGRLFFSIDGKDYTCSASCVGGNLVITAGHCVYMKTWFTNLNFFPQYDNGATVGNFPISEIYVSAEWQNTNNWDFDYAFMVTASPMTNIPALPINFSVPNDANGQLMALGYPAVPKSGYPFNGNQMWQAVGEYGVYGGLRRRGELRMSGNEMTAGCSGGPWVVGSSGSYQIISVESGSVGFGLLGEFGARLLVGAEALYQVASGASPQWQATLPNGGGATWPAFVQGNLFVGSLGRVSWLDPVTGATSAVNTLGGLGAYEVRVASDGYRAFAGINGYVVGIELSAFTDVAWKVSLSGSEVVNVQLGFEGLFAGSDGYVYQINPPDGAVVEKNGLSGWGHEEVRMVVDGESVYVGSNNRVGRIARRTFGSLAWTTTLGGSSGDVVSVLLAGGKLFAGADNHVYALEMATGAMSTVGTLDGTTGQSTEVRLATDGANIFAACNGNVAAWPIAGGNALWTQTVGSTNASTSILWLTGVLLVGSAGTVTVLNALTGAVTESRTLALPAETEIATDRGLVVFAGINGAAYGVTAAVHS